MAQTDTVCEYTYDDGTLGRALTHADFIAEVLPDPSQTFTLDDLPDDQWVQNAFRALRVTEIVEDEGMVEVEYETKYSDERRAYSVNADIRDYVDNVIRNRETLLPCGHPGFENDGGDLRCTFQGCDEVYDKDDVQEGMR